MTHAATKTEQVAELSKQGLGIREIANATGLPPHHVHNLRVDAKKAGHVFPSLKDTIGEEEHAEIARLYGLGWTHKEIAKGVGRSQSAVQRSLYSAGLLRRGEAAPKVKQGFVGRALSLASEDAQRWILGQVPEGGNLAETLVEIALDQYFEKGGAA